MLVVVEYYCLASQQILNNVESGRFTHITYIAFVGDAQHKNSCAIETAALFVQCLTDLIHDLMWHATIDLHSQFKKACRLITRFEFPARIMRINRTALS